MSISCQEIVIHAYVTRHLVFVDSPMSNTNLVYLLIKTEYTRRFKNVGITYQIKNTVKVESQAVI